MKDYLNAFEFLQNKKNEPLVLVTLFHLEGSGYRKPGTVSVFSGFQTGEKPEWSDLISGGCLEADVHSHACEVVIANEPKTLMYDSTDESPGAMMSLGLGCAGKLFLLLEPLNTEPKTSQEKHIFCNFLNKWANNLLLQPAHIYLSIKQEIGKPLISEWSIHENSFQNPKFELTKSTFTKSSLSKSSFSESSSTNSLAGFQKTITPRFRVSLVGAGPDAIPVARNLLNLGYVVTVFDTREVALEQMKSLLKTNQYVAQNSLRTMKYLPDNLQITAENFADAFVIMSHNLHFDTIWLAALHAWLHTRESNKAQISPCYIGVLGPTLRTQRALKESKITEVLPSFQQILHSPVGLKIGSESPEEVALSIVAEVLKVEKSRLTIEDNK